MLIEAGLLPDLGKWTGAVAGSFFALQLLAGGRVLPRFHGRFEKG